MKRKMSFGYTAVAIFFVFAINGFTGLMDGHAQQTEKFPTRPIEFVVPWGPGGGADQVARKSASLMEPLLGVSIPVINAPGASGQTGLMKMLTQPTDGYQIQVMTGDTYSLIGSGTIKIKPTDFVPLAIMIQQPSGFFIKQDSPWKTWADVEKAAKTKVLKVAITGFDSPDDITVNYFASKGLKFLAVPYAKPGERFTSILGNHADLLYEQAGDVRSFVDSHQIRPVIFFSDKKFSVYPNIPVSKELGYEVTLPQFRVVIIKAGTDPKRVKLLADALGKVAASAPFKQYLKEQYAEENSYVSLQDAQKYMEVWMAEAKRWLAATAEKKK